MTTFLYLLFLIYEQPDYNTLEVLHSVFGLHLDTSISKSVAYFNAQVSFEEVVILS